MYVFTVIFLFLFQDVLKIFILLYIYLNVNAGKIMICNICNNFTERI